MALSISPAPVVVSTEGKFAFEWYAQASPPTMTYANPTVKWTKVGDLITLEFPEMRMAIQAASDVSINFPAELLPTAHPDGLSKAVIFATQHGPAYGSLWVDPLDPYITFAEMPGVTWPTDGSTTTDWFGFTMSYHIAPLVP